MRQKTAHSILIAMELYFNFRKDVSKNVYSLEMYVNLIREFVAFLIVLNKIPPPHSFLKQ